MLDKLTMLQRKIIGDPKTIPLEHRVFNIAAIVGFFMCFSAVFLNIIIFDAISLIIAPLLMLIMTLILYYMSAVRKKHLFASYAALGLLTFGLYPIIWIGNGGSLGPVAMYYLLNGMLIPFLLQDGRKSLMVALNVITIAALYFMEYFLPDQITLYSSTESRLIDHGFSFIVLFIVVFFLTQSVMNEYRLKVRELNEMKESFKFKSERDALTGIFNRGYILDNMEEDLVERDSGIVALIMLDIDNFKSINDTYGHQFGDEVIVKVAKTVQKQIRKSDIVGRIGGEEFLVYLPECDCNNAEKVAEGIRSSIESINWKDKELKVTVSVGVVDTNMSETHASGHVLLQKVDSLMYKSKTTGKNKVSVS